MKKQLNDQKTQEKVETRTRKIEKLNVNDYSFESLEKTRLDLVKLTQAFIRQELPEHSYRALIYGINSVTKLLIHEKISALEERIKGLEKGRKI
jgi:hypothetical protein